FELHRPVEATGGDVLTDGLEPPYDVGDLLYAQQAYLAQHGVMGDRAVDVVMIEALVDVDGGSEALHEGIRGLGESSAPGFDGVLVLVAHDIALSEWVAC